MKKIIPFILVMTILSCSEEQLILNEISKSEPRLVDGLLEFDDIDQIHFFFSQKINNPNSIGASKNFVSFDDAYKTALEDLNQSKNIEEHLSLLLKYESLIQLSDSTYSPKISNFLYRTIANSDGLYIAGGFVHKVLNNNLMVISDKKNLEEVRLIESIESLPQSRIKFDLFEYQIEGSKLDNAKTQSLFCGDQLQASYYNNPSGCKNDRTVSIRAYTSFTVAGSFYTPNLISEAWGMKRNWLCNWSHYETKLQTRDSWINVYMRIESSLGDGIYFVYDFPDYNGAVNG